MSKIKRKVIDGRRYYEVTEGSEVIGLFPSITTVLGETSDKSGLEEWRNKVGHEEADRISRLSMNRGTIMHRLIELYRVYQNKYGKDNMDIYNGFKMIIYNLNQGDENPGGILEFKKFNDELDEFRNEKFEDIVPEMKVETQGKHTSSSSIPWSGIE